MTSEAIVVGEGGEFPLNGMLTLPDDLSDPVPAVVMVHGSGPDNMDERVMKLTPFKDLAEGLSARGIASVRYDKRTFAHKRKMAKTFPTIWDETIEDALLAIELAKADERIDTGKVFILGHSMGAMLAPRIDAEGGNAKGLVLMAGSPARLEDIVVRQLRDVNTTNPIVKWLVGLEYKMYAKKFDGLYGMSDEEAKRKKFAGNVTLYYFKEMGAKTADKYLLESDKPVFIMQGEMDTQVLVEEDFTGFQELLAGRANTEFKLYPGLNHCFVEALSTDITKTAKEYGTERHIGDEVLDDIAAFVKGAGK